LKNLNQSKVQGPLIVVDPIDQDRNASSGISSEKFHQFIGVARDFLKSPSEDFLWAWKVNPTETEDLNELTLVVSHRYNPRTFSLKTYVVDKKKEEESH